MTCAPRDARKWGTNGYTIPTVRRVDCRGIRPRRLRRSRNRVQERFGDAHEICPGPAIEITRTLHRQPRPAAQAGAGGARAPFAQPRQCGARQCGAALSREPSRHRRRVSEGGASSARTSIRAKHGQVRAPGLRRTTAVDGRPEPGRGAARAGSTRGVNSGGGPRHLRGSSRQPGVNALQIRSPRSRITKVKRPRFQRAFSSCCAGRI